MRELPVIEDKRLLGALDYIDERFIAEVTEEYEIFDTAPGAKLPPRARMYRFRQFAALAACLLLLSFASLGVNHVANAVISFVASAGGSLNEYGSKYERAIDAYPADMPVEDIYEDVLKGGWVVVRDKESKSSLGIELWLDFIDKVEQGRSASVLIAYYSETPLIDYADELNIILPSSSLSGAPVVKDGAMIILVSIEYDGSGFIRSEVGYNPSYAYQISEYSYLHAKLSSNGQRKTFYLSNYPINYPKPSLYEVEWESFFSDGVISIWGDKEN